MERERVAIVTGGAQGIGRGIVETFLREGYHTVVLDKQRTMEEEKDSWHRLTYLQGDLTQKAFLEEATAKIIEDFGRIDCLIHNAGASHEGILSGCSYEAFNEILHLGITAPYYLTLKLKDHFAPGASVVNIASTRAHQSQADTESYSAAKGGLLALTHALAMSLAGVARVNAISPGWIDTQNSSFHGADLLQHPSKKVGVPQDVARIVWFLCQEDSSFINGQEIIVDGGMSRRMIYHGDEGWQYQPQGKYEV